jgi:hypothetical protein
VQTRGIGGHHQPIEGRTNEWYTPPHVFEALGLEFDLDPCAPPGGVPWVPARRHYSIEDDGLTQPWEGRCWVNPPYGPHASLWMRRLAAHGNGIGLVFARTDTAWFHSTVPAADAVCFLEGRLNFLSPERRMAANRTNSNAGAPSILVAYGLECAEAVAASGLGLTFAVRARGLRGQASLWEQAAQNVAPPEEVG